VPPAAVQAAFRDLFAHWGLPARIRVDRGHPWGSWSGLPPALALWWIGLGIAVVWNRPRRPQHNGQVERFHGLLEAWGEPATCPDAAAWEARAAWVVVTQRERYPTATAASRATAYPALAAGGRAYDPAAEAVAWDLARVRAVLGTGVWARTVDKVGRISLYDHAYGVGRAHAGAQVWVRFDARTGEWVVRTADDTELARHPARELTAARIRALTVGERLPARLNSTAEQLP
jgi:hypothetical protein